MRARSDVRVWVDASAVAHLCVYHVLPCDPPRYLCALFARGRLRVDDDRTFDDLLALVPVDSVPLACHVRLVAPRRAPHEVDVVRTLKEWYEELWQNLVCSETIHDVLH